MNTSFHPPPEVRQGFISGLKNLSKLELSSSSSSSSDANGEKPKKKKPDLKGRRGNITSNDFLKELLEKHN